MTRDVAIGLAPSGRITRTAETQAQKAFGMFYEKHTNSSSPLFLHSTQNSQKKRHFEPRNSDDDSFAFLPIEVTSSHKGSVVERE